MARESTLDLGAVPVLIIDDEAASAQFLAGTLQSHGYDTKIAASAEEAMAVVGGFGPHAIVLDLVLPQLSGVVLAEQLKQHPATRDIPIIATSPFKPEDAEAVARGAGCDDYVRKPIDPASFARLLRDHLERAK